MKRITFINSDFFNKNKRLKLTTVIISGTILANSIAYGISDSRYYQHTMNSKATVPLDICYCGYEPSANIINDFDKITWDKEYINEKASAYCPRYIDLKEIKTKIFRGSSNVTHYRIITKKFFSDDTPELKWEILPDNDIIMINIEDIPEERRYGQNICIEFGCYNDSTNKIDKINSEYLTTTANSKEEYEEHEKVHDKIKEIARSITDEGDSDFEKVKKIYDYLISHTEYRYSKDGIYEKSLYNKFYMDCTGYAEFMNLALNSVGVECFSAEDFTHGHVWNIVKIEDKYYHLDATYSDTSSWEDTSKYRYFLVSDEFMLADHRFFTPEKSVKCNENYDLTGVVLESDVIHRGLLGEQINNIEEGHRIGEIKDGGYGLKYKTK